MFPENILILQAKLLKTTVKFFAERIIDSINY